MVVRYSGNVTSANLELKVSNTTPGADLAFFQGGGGFDPTTMRSIVLEPRSGEPIFLLFWTPISDVFLASTNAMETIVHEPRSGEPIFLLFWTPVSDVFLASTNAMETIVHEPRSGEPIFFCYFEPP